jgi:hypothetical protein
MFPSNGDFAVQQACNGDNVLQHHAAILDDIARYRGAILH